MVFKKVLTVRKQMFMCLSALSIFSFIAFTNPLICKAVELDNVTESIESESKESTANTEESESKENTVESEESESKESTANTEESESKESTANTEESESEKNTVESEENTELTERVSDISTQLTDVVTLQSYIMGILIFFVVVILCKYTYKFFNMFF